MVFARQLSRTFLFALFLFTCFSAAFYFLVWDWLSGVHHERTRTAQRLLRLFCWCMKIKIETRGDRPNQPGLIVSNHISWMDIPVLGSRVPLRFLSKSEVRRWPLIGALAEAAGTLFIERGSGQSGRVRQQIAEKLREQVSVLVFPEGTTTGGTSVKRFHSRLLYSAQDARSCIHPITIQYLTPQGAPCTISPFIGEDEFRQHLWQVFACEVIQVRIHYHASIPIDLNSDIEAVTTQIEHCISRSLVSTTSEFSQAA